MSFNGDSFLKKSLGNDFFESLAKVELWKPGTRTTIDHEEIKTALKIVPRTVMAILIRELTSMQIGESKEVNFTDNAILKVTKHERDVYSGTLDQDNRVIVDFKYRSLPGIGLVIMSALELYDVSELQEQKETHQTDISNKIQEMIEQRLAMHDLVNRVVDRKLIERDAVQQLILAKVTDSLKQEKVKSDISNLKDLARNSAPMEDQYFRGMANGLAVADSVVNDRDPQFVEDKNLNKSDTKKKGSPLDSFLETRKGKTKKQEFSIQLAKGEQVSCPDCGGNIFDGRIFSGCICVGDDMAKKVFLKKTEDGIKVRFSQGWDPENIEMLLEILRRKNG